MDGSRDGNARTRASTSIGTTHPSFRAHTVFRIASGAISPWISMTAWCSAKLPETESSRPIDCASRYLFSRLETGASSPNLATSPEYRRVGETIAFSTTSAPPTIVTPDRDRVIAV